MAAHIGYFFIPVVHTWLDVAAATEDCAGETYCLRQVTSKLLVDV